MINILAESNDGGITPKLAGGNTWSSKYKFAYMNELTGNYNNDKKYFTIENLDRLRVTKDFGYHQN